MYRTLNQLCSRSFVLNSNEKYLSVDDPIYKKLYAYPSVSKAASPEEPVSFSMLAKRMTTTTPVNPTAPERHPVKL